MKKLFTLIGVATLLATVPAMAQNDAVVAYGSIALPLTFAAGTTNYASTNGAAITLKQQNMAVSGTVSSALPGATNVFYFAPSADGQTWDTNSADLYSFRAACNGQGPVTCATNWNVAGFISFKLYSVATFGTATNGALTAANAAVNGLNYSIKLKAP